MSLPDSPLAQLSLVCAAGAAITLVTYLVRRPPLAITAKLFLLLGLGVLPITSAVAGNVEGYERTKERSFCGSCHVMGPYTDDARDPKSLSLASRHSRNPMFGNESCYTCHADYGMFGTVTTKLGGMRHVWEYYGNGYHAMSLDEAKTKIHLRRPMSNDTCMQCHTTTAEIWGRQKEHQAALEDVRSGRVSCASSGCHGYAHPFTKPEKPR